MLVVTARRAGGAENGRPKVKNSPRHEIGRPQKADQKTAVV